VGHGEQREPQVATAELDTHVPPQVWKPPLQVKEQLPVQVGDAFGGAVQASPQAVQWAMLPSGISQPFASLPSQFPWVELHEPIAHEPVAHVADALLRVHETPQPPQLEVVFKRVSQPLPAPPPQSPNPGVQLEIIQEPLVQFPVALGGSHRTPQPPQLLS
jgi:hypothetical protein